jgi:phosphatidylglycerol---prolipoprotein diacylglyceryl transferase
MYPNLFGLPLIHTYGVVLVVGFLAAVFLMRKLAHSVGEDPDCFTNTALYALIAGVIGARLFYVLHNFSQFRGRLLSVFATWQGGLEFLGGFIVAVAVALFYIRRNKRSIKVYFDILAIGLMLGLAFGRVGCFCSGCCFGKPADTALSIRFPYASDAYRSQVYPNPSRDRLRPHLELPAEYFGYIAEGGQTWYPTDEANKYRSGLKPKELLTEQQLYEVTKGKFRCLAVLPTQFYSSANAVAICVVLCFFWRSKFAKSRPGVTFSLMCILYGVTRFMLEYLRDDNPFEYAWWIIYKGGTISQNIGIYQTVLGIILLIIFAMAKPLRLPKKHP